MNNSKNALSFFVQAMVQNYLEHQYNTESVKIYPELINDLDILKRDIKECEEFDNLMNLRVLLDQISDDYIESYEVSKSPAQAQIKCCEVPYLTKTQNLIQLITKIHYPTNTKLILLLVPSRHNVSLKNIINNDSFDKLRQKILSLDEQKQYKIFNALCNDQEYKDSDIINTLASIMIRLEKNKLKYDFGDEKNLTNEEFKMVEDNFKKVDIKAYTLEELEKYPMTPEFQHEYIYKLSW